MRLTFDDGPSEYTEQLLPVLADAGVRATFFMVGHQVDRRPELAAAVHGSGHRIGNHSYSHPRLTELAADAEVICELRKCNEALERAGVPAPTTCRPPYGATDARVEQLIQSEGMEQVLWDVAARDWDVGVTPAEIVERIKARQARAPADPVVLLHDGRGDRSATVEAVKRLLA